MPDTLDVDFFFLTRPNAPTSLSLPLEEVRELCRRVDGVVLTFLDISAAKTFETTEAKALALLLGRFENQSKELDAAKVLEGVLQKAQDVLESRLETQGEELRQSSTDLRIEKEATDET